MPFDAFVFLQLVFQIHPSELDTTLFFHKEKKSKN